MAFDALYYNKDGLQDKFVDYWNHTSAVFAGNPFVVVFDPLNEPYIGKELGLPKDLKTLLPGNVDKHKLTPMYSRLYDVYQ